MNTRFTRVFSLICTISLLSTISANAQTKLISFWDFNQTRPLNGASTDTLGGYYSYRHGSIPYHGSQDSTDKVGTLFATYSANAPAPTSNTYTATAAAGYARISLQAHGTALKIQGSDNATGGSFIYDYSSNHNYFGNTHTYYANDTNGAVGNGTANLYVKALNPVQLDTVYLFLPTNGYQNIQLEFAMSQSSTTSGPQDNIFQYSTNGGTSWNKLTSAMDTFHLAGIHEADTLYCGYMNTTWYPVKINFSSDPTTNNNSNFIIRWEFAGGTVTGTSGNDRYDNMAIVGDSVCPTFTSQPVSSTACGSGGGSTSFSVGIEGGTSVSFQWYVNTGSGYTSITNGAPYSNATTGTLTITGATGSMNGYLYECQVSNTSCGTITSNAAILTVDPVLTVGISTFTNVTCAGNGSATASASGGTSPYTYSWSNAQTNSTATNLTAGVYTITVKDAIGCSGSTTVNIGQNGVAVIITSTTNVECTAFGSATAVGSNGTSPYTYSWSDGETNATASTLNAGTYTISVKDNTGCTGSTTVTILQITSMRDSITGQYEVIHYWDFNNTLPSGGAGGDSLGTSTYPLIAPYSLIPGLNPRIVYSHPVADGILDNGAAAAGQEAWYNDLPLLGNDTAGIATNNVYIRSRNTDAGAYMYLYLPTNGFSNVKLNYAISVSSTKGANYNLLSYSTNGGSSWNNLTTAMDTFKRHSNGPDSLNMLTSTAEQAGTAWTPIHIDFSSDPNTNNNPNFIVRWTFLAPGNTGTSGNDRYDNISISGNALTVTCNGGNNFIASAGVKYGIAPYTYSWNPGGSTSNMAAGLVAGTYTLTVKDASGCSATTAVTVSQPPLLSAGISSSTNIACNGYYTGQATASASGGTSPYNYSWSPSGGTTNVINGVSAGTYSVTITDAVNCTATTSVTLSQPIALTINASVLADASCNIPGSASSSASGGTSPYTYSWSNNETSSNATGLTAGIYTITISDSNGCSNTAFVSITEPATLGISLASITNASCNGGNGSITANAPSGGTTPYTYSWSGGGGTNQSAIIPAGTYTLTASDNNGCIATISATITQPATGVTITIASTTNASCTGDGSATANIASGGTPPYTYSWSSAGGTNLTITATAGTYTITATDNNGCSSSISAIIAPSIQLRDSITLAGQYEVIHYWDFNNTPPAGGAGGDSLGTSSFPLVAPYSVIPATNPRIVYSHPSGEGILDNAAPAANQEAYYNDLHLLGNDTGGVAINNLYIRSRNPDANAYMYLYLPTSGFTNVNLNYAISVSSTKGANFNLLSYSTNGGSSWNNLTTAMDTFKRHSNGPDSLNMLTSVAEEAGTAWTPIHVDFSSDPNTNNNLNFVVRWTFLAPSNTGTSGNDRYDNISLSGNTMSETCNGGNEVSATAGVKYGTAPYTYSWSPSGGSSSSASNLVAGTYTLSIKDANGCSGSSAVTISNPPLLTTTIPANISPTCFGGNNGSATGSVTGGTVPYKYSWSAPGGTQTSISGLSAGTYTLTVTDAFGCTATASSIITQPLALIASIAIYTNATCSTNGSATAGVTNGTSPYTYSWSDLSHQTAVTATNLLAGTYTVTVTDNHACSGSASVTITQPTNTVSVSILSFTNVECATNGTATASVNNGTSPYTYSWSNGETSSVATGLAAGTYTITVKDNLGCSSFNTVTISQLPQIRDSVSVLGQYEVIHYWDFNNTPPSGGGGGDSLGTVTFPLLAPYTVIPGGNPRIIYSHPSAIQTGATIVDGILDNGAPATGQEAWNNDLPLLGNDTAGNGINNLFVRSRNPDVNAFMYLYIPSTGFSNVKLDYAISVSSTKGANYNLLSYSTNGGSTWQNLTTAMDTFKRHSNGPDSLNMITATPGESSGTAWTPIHVDFSSDPMTNNNPNLVVRWTFLGPSNNATSGNDRYDNISLSGNLSTETCNGGNEITATSGVKYGTAPYTYSWNPGGGSSSVASNLLAGTYTFTVKDALGCSSSSTITVSQPALLTASIPSPVNITCTGGNNGSLTAVSRGGTSPYKYSWSSPGGTLATLSGLSTGTYSVTITDAYGCTTSTIATLTQPLALIASIATYTNATCSGNGDATAGVTNGTSPYTYSWTDPSHQTTVTATNLTAGTYTVSITDNHGCTGSASVTITQPANSVSVSIGTHTNVECTASGTATALASGGISPYTYSWSDGETTSVASALSAGTYTITIRDNTGCNSFNSVTILQVPQIQDSIIAYGQYKVIHYWDFNNTSPSSGAGGDSLGTSTYPLLAPYTLIPGGNPRITYNRPLAIQPGASVRDSILDNLTPGAGVNDLPVLGNDSNSLAAGNLGIRSRNPDENQFMTLYLPTTGYSNIVMNYAISVSSTKGANYNIISYSTNGGTSWKNLTTAMDTFKRHSNGPDSLFMLTSAAEQAGNAWTPININFSSDPSVNNNPNFIVRWQFEGSTSSGTSGNDRYDNISLSGNLSTETCYGGDEVTANAAVKNGTLPYTYTWTPSGGSTGTASNLTAGTYTLTVNDANGCSSSSSVTISQPAMLTATIDSLANVPCNGYYDGAAKVVATGGTPPYNYSWAPSGGTISIINGVPAGIYTLTVSDILGCTSSLSITLTQPVALAVNANVTANVNCNGGTNGVATAIASGDVAPYTYQWSDGSSQSTASATGLSAGTYTIMVSDSCSNTATASVVISQPALLGITIATYSNVLCFGGNGSITANTPVGGTSPYTYSWSPAGGTSLTASVSAGTYTISVTDSNGCNASASATITQPATAVSISISSVTNASCNTPGTATANAATGGTSPYSYSWSAGGGTNLGASFSTGTYTITATDANGCAATASATITQPPAIRDSISVAGQLEVIHYWDFNNTLPAGGGGGDSLGTNTFPLPAPYSLIPGSNPRIVYHRPTGIQTTPLVCTKRDSILDNFEPSTPPTPPYCYINDLPLLGNDSGGAATGNIGIRSRNPDENAYMYLYLPTTGFSNVQLNYAISASSTKGAFYNVFSYSTNGGTSWNKLTRAMDTFNISGIYRPDTLQFINPTTSVSAWYPVNINFSSDPTVNNNPNFILRWQFEGSGSNGTSGNARYDNISLSGDLHTETCVGGNEITATAGTKYGTPPYTYSWSPSGGTGSSASNLTAGTYTLSIKDANGCTGSSTVTVSNPALLTATISSATNVTCSGGATGNASATVTGGASPYKYSWSVAGATLSTISGLSAGTYTLTATDAFGCTATNSLIITQPSAIVASIANYTNATCSANGSATAAANNGTSPYTYSWSDPAHQTTITATNLTAGTYTITVIDNNGCAGSASVTITQPANSVSVSIGAYTNVECTASGTATADVSGGTSPYTYSWSDGETTSIASALSAGTYSITVSDNTGCKSINTVTILQVAQIRDSIIAYGQYKVIHYWDFNNTPPSSGAGGDSLGTSTNPLLAPYTLIPGGNPRIVYDRPVAIQPGASLRDSILDNLSPGAGVNDLPLLGNDSGGISAGNLGIRSRNPDENQFMTLYLPTTGYSNIVMNYAISVSSTKGANYNIISYSTNGGTSWKNLTTAMDTFKRHSNGPDSLFMLTSAAEQAGNAWTPININFSSDPSVNNNPNFMVRWQFEGSTSTGTSGNDRYDNISLSGNLSTETCYDGNEFTANAGVKNGSMPYTYSWSPSGGSGSTASSLTAGTYTLTVKDFNGCSSSSSVTISQPALLTATIASITNIPCNGFYEGAATAGASGGTSPYNYSWSPSGGTINTINGVSAGTYTISVTDILGCTSSSSVILTQPNALTANASVITNVNCSGNNTGVASSTASGDASPYTYQWSDATSQTTATATGLSAGTYTVTVQDSCGYSVTASAVITQPASSVGITISSVSNVPCFGGSGTVTANSAIGGTSPYTYSWSNSGGNNLIAIFSAGTYTLTVSDSSGCTATTSVTLTQPAANLGINVTSSTNVSCYGGTGALSATTATGGTSPYTYTWDPNGGSNLITTALSPGTYTIIVIDNHGCTSTSSGVITQPASALGISISSVTNALCNGNTGSITANTATGGTSPYTYSWSPAGGTGLIANVSAGTYTITVTDNHGCSATASTSVSQSLYSLGISISAISNINCRGQVGRVTANSATGGSSPYTYSWSGGGGTNLSALYINAGTYTITVTDANGCIASASATITQTPYLGISISSVTNVHCFGGTGTITASTATGGTSPYTYAWDPSGGTNLASTALAAGTYTIVVIDNNGCTSTATASITQPSTAVGISIGSVSDVLCYGGNGSVSANGATGGVGPYTYSWSGGGGSGLGASLSAGTYTITATDNNGCSATASGTISQPATALGISISSVVNVTSFGGSNGSATANAATGGTSPYTYTWYASGGNGLSATGLSAGTYTILVVDNNGCTNSATATITQPSNALGISIASVSNVSCNGGSNGIVSANGATGGTPPYTYSWSGGAGSSLTATVSAGTYTVTVTDSNGVTATAAATVTQPSSALGLSISSINDIGCNGGTGSATANGATGGTSPYTYSWSGGAGNSLAATGLSAGTYTITVSDSNGCNATLSATITQPANSLGISILSETNISCFGGSGTATANGATGGTSPYTYSWSGGAGSSLAVNNLSAGTYTITVNDNNGCSTTTSAIITQPANALGISIASTSSVSCNGGFGSLTANAATGGTSPYTYAWYPTGGASLATTGVSAGTYTIIAIDNNGCTAMASATITQPATALGISIALVSNINCYGGNGSATANAATGGTLPYTYSWSGGGGSSLVANLSAGTYTFTATDSNGCSASALVTITQPASALGISISSIVNVTAFGGSNGSATATAATGGTSPYTYTWYASGGNGLSATGLSAGTYTILVVDNNGCTNSAIATITQPSNALGISIASVSNVSCYGGNGTLSANGATGGTSPYTYSWSDGAGSNLIVSVSAGTYTMTVTDNNGVTGTASATVTQPSSALGISIASVINIGCNGGTGSATANGATGGTSPYTYSWSGGAGSTLTVSVSAGTYTITVSDSNGCSATATATITQPTNALGISIASASNISCNGGTGNITVNAATGGISPYTYSWSGGAGSNLAVSVSAGTYTITVNDSNGCSATATATITQPVSPLGISIASASNVSCNGGTGIITTTGATGGTVPYTYSWSGGAGSSITATVSAGSYTVTITDSHGCTATATATVTQPGASLAVSTAVSSNVSCNGLSNGSGSASVSGGTSPYTYSWSTGSVLSSVSGLSAGTYTVNIEDNNGCSASHTLVIGQPALLTVSTVISSNVSCNGGANGLAKAGVGGGTAPYTYSWSPNTSSTYIANGLSAGTYRVSVEDKNGCTATALATITQPSAIRDSLASVLLPNCHTNLGSATIGVKGGTSPYTYIWNPNVSTGASASGLAIRSYVVEVKDAHGCASSLAFSISQPPSLRDSIVRSSVVEVACGLSNSGSAGVGVKYGAQPYTYSWSPNVSSTATGSGLSVGTYTVTVSDANNCSATAAVTITQTPGLTITTVITDNVSCNGGANGQAKAGVAGGVSPYTYSWSPNVSSTYLANGLSAGTYTVSVTDKNGCNNVATAVITQPAAIRDSLALVSNASCHGGTGSATIGVTGGSSPYTYTWNPNVSSTATAAGLTARTYIVGVKDAHGCTAASVTFSITQPVAVRDSIVRALTVNIVCNGSATGSATVGVRYGSSPYSYSWNPVGGNAATGTGMPAGVYTVTVMDGCANTATASVTLTQPGELRDSISSSSCSGSLVTATVGVKGGVAPYTYSWTPGGGSRATMSGLSAGTYTITVMDKHGCSIELVQGLSCDTVIAAPYHAGNNTGSGIPEGILNVNLYPNPNTGQFTVSGIEQGMRIEVYDYTGERISVISAADETMQVNISTRPDGVYLVRILDKDGNLISQKKVVKVK